MLASLDKSTQGRAHAKKMLGVQRRLYRALELDPDFADSLTALRELRMDLPPRPQGHSQHNLAHSEL